MDTSGPSRKIVDERDIAIARITKERDTEQRRADALFRSVVDITDQRDSATREIEALQTIRTSSLTKDVDRRTSRQRARESAFWDKVRRAETTYATQLRKIARQVADLIRTIGPVDPQQVIRTLQEYAKILDPWAKATAGRMIAEVARRDEKAWFDASRAIGRSLGQELFSAPLGTEVQRLVADQVGLITSLPLEAAQRVQRLAIEAAPAGKRYQELVPEILKTGPITVNRATLIARTETAKVQSAITQVRAKYVGSEAYVWRTARDRDVRPAHKRLEGKVFKWDDPPIAEENGDRHHPGCFPNCRCYSEPILPAVIR